MSRVGTYARGAGEGMLCIEPSVISDSLLKLWPAQSFDAQESRYEDCAIDKITSVYKTEHRP
jgi:hypothetical protein